MPQRADTPTRLLQGIGIGVALTIPSAVIAMISGGAGHGDYALARLLFPAPMLLTRLFEDRIAPPLIVLALIQFPAYGAILASSWGRKRAIITSALVLAGTHSTAAILAFSGLLPNFS